MYCNQCGNIVMDGAMFCSFCGAKCSDVTVAKAGEAVQAAPDTAAVPAAEAVETALVPEIPSPEAAPAIEPSAEAVQTSAAPEPAAVYSAPAVQPEAPSYPAPVAAQSTEVPRSYSTVSFNQTNQSTAPDFSSAVPAAEQKPQETTKTVKYYTLGQLMLCLAAVGVMAAVAGIFAGLYFSVI